MILIFLDIMILLDFIQILCYTSMSNLAKVDNPQKEKSSEKYLENVGCCVGVSCVFRA